MRIFFYHLIYLIVFNSFTGFLVNAQCTEAKEPDMAKYKRLTETQDAQACSQCAMLALYFCSAKHCVDVEDKRKVRSLIEACKGNIRNMGQPYCCPELVNKEPQWGIAVGSGNTSVTSSNSTSETSQEELEEGFQELTEGSQTNPDNPLGVTPQMLNEIASLIPNENLKSVLEGYANNLGSNQDISFRQVYNDLLSAFDLNPAIGMTNDYSSKQGALDLMFNQPLVFQDFFKNSGLVKSDAEARLFSITTQAMLTNYQNVTAADALGAVSDLITMYAEDAARQKALEERFNEMLEQTKKSFMYEKDPKLGGALIDATIGQHQMDFITPIFRYDSDSGYSVRVENGVLTYFNSKMNNAIPLLKVYKKNDLSISSSYPARNFISINEKDNIMFLRVIDELGKDFRFKKGLYLISLKDGSVIWQSNKQYFARHNIEMFDIEDIQLNNEGFGIYVFHNDGKKWMRFKRIYSIPKNEVSIIYTINNRISFDFKGKKKSFLSSDFRNYEYTRSSYTIGDDENDLTLLWRAMKNNENSNSNLSHTTSSAIILGKNVKDEVNTDGMTNELTGIVKSQNGDLYFTDSNGGLGVLKNNSYTFLPKELPGQIRNTKRTTIFPSYDFNSLNDQTTPISTVCYYYAGFPRLFLSPDEKWLLYSVKDELFIVDPSDLTKIKSFKLTNEPHRSYFGKENGDWVLYLQSINELQFPITKKYSMKRLTQDTPAPTVKEVAPSTPSSNSTKKTSTKPTTSKPATTKAGKEEELQRLIELYTKGLISEEEFKKAKAKLSE